MFTGYLSLCSIVLWLMLGYVCFSYLIRILMFFNWYRCLDYCALLSGKVFLQFLLLWCILVPPPSRSFFIPCGQNCSTTWMCVPSPGCWHCSIFCSILWREREKTNKMQQLDVYYEHCLNMFRASLCPSSGEQRPVLLHAVCCAGPAGCGW